MKLRAIVCRAFTFVVLPESNVGALAKPSIASVGTRKITQSCDVGFRWVSTGAKSDMHNLAMGYVCLCPSRQGLILRPVTKQDAEYL